MQILDFILNFEKLFGRKPEFIPVTPAEITEIKSKSLENRYCSSRTPEIFGIEVFRTEYGDLIRENIKKDIRLEEYSCIALNDIDFRHESYDLNKHIFETFLCKVCTDITELEIELICDPFEKLKKRFPFLQRFFPMKKKKAKIEGRVLYPYLKISLPNNRQHIQFNVNSEHR